MTRLLTTFLLLLSVFGYAQAQRVVTGTVKGDDGEMLIGATISVKGTRLGTRTDLDGKYSVQIPDGSNVLIFSYTGYATQEIEVGATNVMDVVLRSGLQLGETVVTALGITRSQKSVPYAVQSVNEDKLNTIRQTNLNNALAGKVAGVQVRSQSSMHLGRDSEIRIRGVGSLTDKRPLYVVDGTPMANSDGGPASADINPDDVESITVLKGPSATALYGQRGDAGVVLITTKKGAKGKGIGIEFNQSTFFDRVYVLPKYQNVYAGGGESELIQFEWQDGMPEEWKALDGKYYHDYSDDASWGPKMEGQEYIPWYAWYPGTQYSYKTASLTPQPDNVRDYYETGVTNNTNLNFTKATDSYSTRFSYTYQDVKGMIPNSGLGKHILSTVNTFDLSKHFTIGANINYVATRTTGTFDDSYANQSSGSFNQWFHRDVDMNIMKELRDMRSPEGILGSWNHNNPGAYLTSPLDFYGGNYWYNFYSWFDHQEHVANRQRLFGDISLTYKFNDKLRLTGFVRRNQETSDNESKVYSILQNSATQTGIYNSYSTGQRTFNEDNYELLATWADRFGSFSVEANLGGNIRLENFKSINGNSDQGLSVPDLFTLGNSVTQPYPYSEYRYKKEVRSVYARGSFGFKDMVYLDWSVRNDWSSALPKDNNSYLYPSIGSSFVFTEVLPENNILSYGKVRASWAQVGSDLGPYQLNLTYPLGTPFGSNFTMFTPDELVDPNIKPALSSAYELGFDMRFLKNRIGLGFTYYNESKIDEIISVAVAGASGFTTRKINAGQIDRSGIELQLDVTPVKSRDLNWDFSVNLGTTNNEVVELAEGIDAQVLTSSFFATRTGVRLVNFVGEQWGQLRGGGIKKINGQPVLTEDGLYTAEPNTYFGSVLPDFTGGFFNTLRYKDFTLALNIDFQQGGKYFSLSHSWGWFSGLFEETAAINENGKNVRDPVSEGGGVKVTGVDENGNPVEKFVDANEYYHQFYFGRIGEPFIHDLTYIKLREVSLGYNLPIRKLGLGNAVQAANLAFVARNPWLIYSPYRNFDASEVSYLYGEMGQFPGTRSFGFNLKVQF